ncbi:MAG: hypothetical protein ACRDQA_22705, partial [Nocardioidaceae bacterium]
MSDPLIEALAEAVHDAYLEAAAEVGMPMDPAKQVPYRKLYAADKELTRACVRAVLTELAARA